MEDLCSIKEIYYYSVYNSDFEYIIGVLSESGWLFPPLFHK